MAQPQVLIAGAGPTGLALALWLTKVGIPVRLIDKTSEPGTTSRAMVFHARNLEFYHQMGIDETVVERGIKFAGVHMWRAGQEVAHFGFGNMGQQLSPYPYALIFPQDQHEKMLIEQLESLGVHVERQTELVDFIISGDGVTAELRMKSGQRESVRYAFLAGCDGARSIVREKLKVGFPGGTYSDTYYVADIHGTGPVFNGALNIALDDADFLAIFPMKGEGRARLIGTVHDPEGGKDLEWDDVSHTIIERLKLEVKEVNWFSTYRVHHRVASAFRQGNVFLLGDAAHIHSPVGGQGMNTGIGDAVNLAWKLAAVLKGTSPATILDTYEPERIAFARRLVASTDRAFAFISSRGPIAKTIRLHVAPRLIPFLFGFAAVRRLMFRTVSQTSIRYPQSALSRGPGGTTPSGDRLPWFQFTDSTGKLTDNFAPLTSMDWQMHCYGEASAAWKNLGESRGVPLHVFPWNSDAQEAGLKKNAAYVIRPEGYIGIIDSNANPSRIASYLDKWLPPK